MGVKLTQSAKNLESLKDAARRRRTGEAPPPVHYPSRPLPTVTLREGEKEQWFVVFGNGSELPATDIEVYLWLELLKKGGPDSPTDTQKKRGGKRNIPILGLASSGGGG